MSSYVDNNLMPNESTIKKGKIHWFGFVPGGILFLLGLTIMITVNKILTLAGVGMILAGTVILLKALVYHKSTELALTSKRVIAKFGFVRRNTIELNHKNVESFRVDQSIFGRILNFGTIHINGTGGISTPIPIIRNPLEFRKMALSVIESSEN